MLCIVKTVGWNWVEYVWYVHVCMLSATTFQTSKKELIEEECQYEIGLLLLYILLNILEN